MYLSEHLRTWHESKNMTTALISIERPSKGVCVVYLLRQHKRNALNAELIQALTDAAVEMREDASIKAVVLTGGSHVFSAGADLQTFQALEAEPNINQLRRMNQAGVRMVEVWEALPAITIAAVEGAAVGGGLALALACDWRVFARDAYGYVPEVLLGLNYGWGALPRLTALAGPGRAKWMAILSRKHSAEELAQWRIVEQLAESGKALDNALILAKEVAALPALAAQIVKQTVNVHQVTQARAASHAEMDHMLLCLTDAEGKTARQEFGKGVGRRNAK